MEFDWPSGPEEYVAQGNDLSVDSLVSAYRHGVFPWPDDGDVIPWCSPDPRCLVPSGQVHASRSLVAQVRRQGWAFSVDGAFARVVTECGKPRPGPGGGVWITRAVREAYVALHEAGHAHSVEVWAGDELVGGVYGVQVGAVFVGESMFHRATGASKAALVTLDRTFAAAGGAALDAQLPTEHLVSMGFGVMHRADYLRVLEALRDADVTLGRPVGWA